MSDVSDGVEPVPSAAQVVARRRGERRQLLAMAEEYAARLDAVDVLVIAEDAPAETRERLRAAGWPPPLRVEPVVGTVAEWRRNLRRGDPIAREAWRSGVWLRGAPEALDAQAPPSGNGA